MHRGTTSKTLVCECRNQCRGALSGVWQWRDCCTTLLSLKLQFHINQKSCLIWERYVDLTHVAQLLSSCSSWPLTSDSSLESKGPSLEPYLLWRSHFRFCWHSGHKNCAAPTNSPSSQSSRSHHDCGFAAPAFDPKHCLGHAHPAHPQIRGSARLLHQQGGVALPLHHKP